MEHRKQFTEERIRDIHVTRKLWEALAAPTTLRLVRAPGYVPQDVQERDTRAMTACMAVYGEKA